MLGLGIMDSSFLFMPLGNDLLMIALTARDHVHMLYYAAMASAGSTLGVLLVDLVVRKGGEEGLERYLPKKRLDYVKKKVSKKAAWAIALACLMPPPFPFTPFIIGAAALQYPRKKLLPVVAGFRMVRFTVEGLLAMEFGRRILKLADEPALRWAILVLVVIAIGGSVFSIIRWVKSSRAREAQA